MQDDLGVSTGTKNKEKTRQIWRYTPTSCQICVEFRRSDCTDSGYLLRQNHHSRVYASTENGILDEKIHLQQPLSTQILLQEYDRVLVA